MLKSPAVPAALLFYVIIFGFAAVFYLNVPWQRSYTMTLYLVVSVWALDAIVRRWRNARPSFNRVDFWFSVFLAQVLLSIAVNWWAGTAKYLEFMPVYFVLPYLLGRVMNLADVIVFQRTLIWMAMALLLLMPFEFIRIARFGLPYSNSPNPTLFAQGHGVMLSGMLLAAAFLTLVSIALRSEGQSVRCAGGFWRRYAPHLGLGLIVLVMGWIAARGPAVVAIAAMIVMFLLSPRRNLKEKTKVAFVFLIFLVLATLYAQQNKYHSTYYQELLRKPPTVEISGTIAIVKEHKITSEFDPILGRAICGTIVDSVTDRWTHYQQALAIFRARPIFGIGANAYGFHACTGPGSFPHSTVLQVMAELGIVGAFVYAALMISALGALMKIEFRETQSEGVHAIGEWAVAFFVFQFLAAQLSGDYFISASLYFTCGLAASFRAQRESGLDNIQPCAS